MIKKFKKYSVLSIIYIGVIMGISIGLSSINVSLPSFADTKNQDVEDEITTYEGSGGKELTYTKYLEKYSGVAADVADQMFLAKDSITNDVTTVDKENSFGYGEEVIKLENKQTASFNLNVKTSGLYNIYVDYYFADTSINDAEASLQLNGEYPYYEARQVLFKADWKPVTTDFQKDRYGNEIVPSSNKVLKWYRYSENEGNLSDGSRLYTNTLKGYFQEGVNELKINLTTGNIYIGAITLASDKTIISYDEYLNDYSDAKKIKKYEIVEPEIIDSKSDVSIRIAADANPKSTPYSTRYKKLNNIYMQSWNKGNQSITWNFEVEEAGLYNLAFKYIQSELVDLPISRTIKIDGKVPYEELNNYHFYYAKKWRNHKLTSSDGNLLYVYLEPGTHTLTMTSNLDDYRYLIEEIDRIMSEMSDVSLQIKALTNGQSDEYRDWEITKYIPTLKDDILRWKDEINELVDYGNQFSKNKSGSSEFSNLKLAVKKLKKLSKDVDQIPNKMTEFTDGDSSVSQYLGNVMLKLYGTPLGLEKIYVGGSGTKLPKANANFFQKMFESIKKFFISFFNDGYNTSDTKKGELEVWVRRSRQYIEVMQKLADEAGINVKFSIMPDENKLVLANASNDLPDVAMGISNWIPYDLALRGITVDLRNFDGYEDVVSKMTPGAMIPYAYEDGMYGLPESQDFWVLFYRTDILGELGIDIPSTWDDVLGILPKLQRYGLNFYEPISLYTGLRPFVATLPFFYQWGGSLYSEDGMTTTLSSEENIKALKFITDLFTIYNLDKEVTSFYNYFRYGTLPIGIANAATYLQLLVAAPEIKGNWNIAIHPGYEKEDGTVSHYACAGSQGITMFKSSDKQSQAWDFIEWWMSTETQENYISTLYSMYGEEYLWFTANLEAFMSIPIPTEHKELILKQWEWAIEVSRIPAAYVIEQTISDAFSQVVFNGENVRIALDNAVITSNREIARKMEEFGYMEDGKKVKDYLVPTIYNIKEWLTKRD